MRRHRAGRAGAGGVTLLSLRPQGLYVPGADLYIDPAVPVPRAVITHAHSDHCRPGHGAVLASPGTLALAAARYGAGAFGAVQALGWGERLDLGGVTLWLAPAGHVLGSAQVVVEAGGRRAVVSGDYKRRADPSCEGFEVVTCDLFVTEATFGLPVFRHPPVAAEIGRLLASLATFPDRPHAIGAYALGKAQRLIRELRAAGYDRPIWLHGALTRLCAVYEAQGRALGDLRPATVAAARPGDRRPGPAAKASGDGAGPKAPGDGAGSVAALHPANGPNPLADGVNSGGGAEPSGGDPPADGSEAPLPDDLRPAAGAGALAGEIVLAPPGALADAWVRRLGDPVIGAASGWMRVRQRARQAGVELALVISDHADWDELCDTVRAVGAAEIWVTHGAEEALCHWCAGVGIRARPLAIAGRGDGGGGGGWAGRRIVSAAGSPLGLAAVGAGGAVRAVTKGGPRG